MSIFSIRTFQSLEQVNLYSPEIIPKSFGLNDSTNTSFPHSHLQDLILLHFTLARVSVSQSLNNFSLLFLRLFVAGFFFSFLLCRKSTFQLLCYVTGCVRMYVCPALAWWRIRSIKITEEWDLEWHWSRYSVGQHFSKSVVSTHVLQVHWVRL